MNEVHLDTGAAALHALDQNESAEFTAHLASCASCRTEYDGFTEALARLGAGLEVLPPPALRDRVLAAARRTPQLPPIVPASPESAPRHAAPEPVIDGPRPEPTRTERERERRWFARPTAWLAAAAVAAVAITGTVLLTQQTPVQTAQECVSTANDRQVLAPAVGTGGDVQHAESCGGAAMVTVPDMPALPAGQVYQLWVMKGADARSVGVVPADGGVMMAQVADGDTDIGVSVEPGPQGSVSPTTDPIWVVTL